MDYKETLEYLYSRLPMFTRVGAQAYKKDLTNTLLLLHKAGNPHLDFQSVHIAGTNGKGSVSNNLASVLQTASYRTGLYTSPHLLDFRERIRIDGAMIPEVEVIAYVNQYRDIIEEIEPSFFEVTVAMAFWYFSKMNVDIAVVETGLGGRLDSTNVINPVLSIITNISFDHQNLLGNTLQEIATEKAGIIKRSTPVIIGEKSEATDRIFLHTATELKSPISFAEEAIVIKKSEICNGLLHALFVRNQWEGGLDIMSPLTGNYQLKNLRTVLESLEELRSIGFQITDHHIQSGLLHVRENTGFRGRWEQIQSEPLVICDVAHNEAGLKSVFAQIASMKYTTLHIIFGMVRDKDADIVLSLLSKEATYYFTQVDMPRALPYSELATLGLEKSLMGDSYPSVALAIKSALEKSIPEDFIFITGSIFIVADALSYFDEQRLS